MTRLKSMHKLLTFCLGLWLFLCANMGAAETRVTTLVVPFSAGSAQDVFARLISEPLARELGASVMVVNKPGAGGTIASAFVASAKPDGQTYLMAASNHHLAGAMYPGLKYHPLNSFRGAAFFGFSDFVLITSSTLKTPDLASFVARVRAQPNAFNYASAGNGSTTHVGMASFLKTAQLQMTHIPLKGTGEIITEILAGRVQAAMVSLLSVSGHRADPRLQILASTHTRRSEHLPQTPTVMETGYPKFQWNSWGGLLAPVATPSEKIQDMSRAVDSVLNDPAMKVRFTQLGISPTLASPAQFDAVLKADWLHSAALIADLKILPD
jgi:tripartite-type tricarboxylate transporter receptor subunit TctC